MENWQRTVLLFYALVSFTIFVKGFYESKYKKNAYGRTPYLTWLGIFFWGDAVVFGFFWFVAATVSMIFNDWILFLLVVSLFWVVRSMGETKYWFNQQFSTIERSPPKLLSGYSIFQNDSIWFVYQIIHQCITVISLIFSIYFAHMWLSNMS